MAGDELLDTMASGTGLPEELVLQELAALLERARIARDTCGLEDLREVLVEYAQEVLLAARNRYAK